MKTFTQISLILFYVFVAFVLFEGGTIWYDKYVKTPEITTTETKEKNIRNQTELWKHEDAMALNVYHEIREGTDACYLSVAQITQQRVDDPRWPDNHHDVVYEPKQYSWTSDGRSDKPNIDIYWRRSVLAAKAAMAGTRMSDLIDSYWYHATTRGKPDDWPDWIVPHKEYCGQLFYVSELQATN